MKRAFYFSGRHHSILYFLVIFLMVSFHAADGDAADYIQVPGLVDLRTTFSDGAYDLPALVQLAKSRGFTVLIVNDHDRVALEYGLPPFRNLIKKKYELNSINVMGAEKYLRALTEAEKNDPDMILIPGSETTPFYYWTGSIFNGSLTAHDHERRLLTVGLDKPEYYENLPILHNDPPAGRYQDYLPGAALMLAAVIASLFLIRWKGFFRIAGISILFISAALFVNGLFPAGPSPYDAYHGDQGMGPYQLVIDHVRSKGGMTFWNYPETKSGVRTMGPIRVDTRPYPQVLEDSRNYTGFSALYGDESTITEPGNLWDLTLKEYCRGLRENPVWGIATGDFHKEGESGEKLGNFQTVFLVREKTKGAILEAMRNGRMYACRGNYPLVPSLNEFSVSSPADGTTAVSGEEIVMKGSARIRFSLSTSDNPPRPVKIRLIRSGELIKMFEAVPPVELTYEDTYFTPGEKVYYRMDMHGAGTVVSNPIFVKFAR